MWLSKTRNQSSFLVIRWMDGLKTAKSSTCLNAWNQCNDRGFSKKSKYILVPAAADMNSDINISAMHRPRACTSRRLENLIMFIWMDVVIYFCHLNILATRCPPM